MKRAWLALGLLLIAFPAGAAEKWWDAYNRGVAAVRAKNYDVAVEALQRSLAEMPDENSALRPRNETIVYVPHFWLGIARYNLGDVEAALREWKISEDQGAVQSTPYYAQLRDWVSRAQSQKQRNLESAAAGSKRDANASVGRAVSAQMDALAAGADRSDQYRAGQRKLREAMDAASGAGTDVAAYRHAGEIAQQARDLFAAAAQEARQQRVARPAPARPQQQPQMAAQAPPQPAPEPQPASQPQPVPQPPAPQPVVAQPVAEPVPQRVEPIPAPTPVEPKALAEPPKTLSVEVSGKAESARSQLEAAYRAFAAGDLTGSEQMLTRMLAVRQSGEAYLLRGCARYTRAALAGNSDLEGAASDFRAALKRNRGLRLDPAAFSPKLVEYFEKVRKGPGS